MTITEIQQIIRKKQRLLVQLENMEVPCHIRDAQTSYGRVRVQIEPVGGTGTKWVEHTRLRPVQ